MVTCRGEYESLKSIYSVCAHTPAPVGWGRYTEDNIDYSFLLVEFMAIQKQVSFQLSRIVFPLLFIQINNGFPF
jgi:hypothetical protein